MNLKSVKSILVAVLVVAIFSPSVLFGHFVWVAKSEKDGIVKIYFGEGPYPDQAMFLGGLKDMKVWKLDSNGKATEIKYEKKVDGSDGWFECESSQGLSLVDADCEYGIFGRGDKTMFLHYAAKYVEFSPSVKTKTTGKLPLDIEVAASNGATKFRILHNGKPAADCELQIVDEENKLHEFKSDKQGWVEHASAPKSQWKVRAKITDATKGESDGKSYDEKRFYCTLVLATAKTITSGESKAEDSTKNVDSKLSCSTPYPEMPVGITSFGGAVAGDHVYIYGGHCGDAHDYYQSGQNSKLYRLNLKDNGADWEEIHDSRGLQGLAMVEHDGVLYRVGGFEARNKQGEEHDLHSVNDFSRFNLETKKWESLKPLPSPRSSLDAVVVGDKLFVVGGWNMQGGKGKTWQKDLVWIDLSDKNSEWQTVEVPFERRALTVGYQGDKLFVVGGMRKRGGPTSEVMIYNIASNKWSEGPNLPGDGNMQGFGCSCFNIGGKLVVSTYGGYVLDLSDDLSQWNILHKMETGRFFHRLLPLQDNKFMLVGGANMSEGKMFELPVFELPAKL